MSLKWIAQQLHMGSWTYVINLLSRRPDDLPLEVNRRQRELVLRKCQCPSPRRGGIRNEPDRKRSKTANRN
jgi:hypothetical protein